MTTAQYNSNNSLTPEIKWTSFEKRNNLDELISIPLKAEERFVIQMSFKKHNPRQKLQLIHDPLCFQNPQIRAIYRTNPQSGRFLRPNLSIRKPIHPPPPGSLDVGAPYLPSSFETSGCSTLSTGANFRSPRWTAVWHMLEEEYHPLLGGFLSDALDALPPFWSR